MDGLGEAVHNREHYGVTLRGRQSSNKIRGNMEPMTIRDGQRL